jgi:hypothetical protein
MMMGRTTAGVPSIQFKKGGQLTWRLHAMKKVKEEFWDRWVKEVFPILLKQSKYMKLKRDVMEGNVVLRKDKTAAGQISKYSMLG